MYNTISGPATTPILPRPSYVPCPRESGSIVPSPHRAASRLVSTRLVWRADLQEIDGSTGIGGSQSPIRRYEWINEEYGWLK